VENVFKSLDGVELVPHNGYVYCHTCWLRNYAPKCGRCDRGVDGGVQQWGLRFHRKCFRCIQCDCVIPGKEPEFVEHENHIYCYNCRPSEEQILLKQRLIEQERVERIRRANNSGAEFSKPAPYVPPPQQQIVRQQYIEEQQQPVIVRRQVIEEEHQQPIVVVQRYEEPAEENYYIDRYVEEVEHPPPPDDELHIFREHEQIELPPPPPKNKRVFVTETVTKKKIVRKDQRKGGMFGFSLGSRSATVAKDPRNHNQFEELVETKTKQKELHGRAKQREIDRARAEYEKKKLEYEMSQQQRHQQQHVVPTRSHTQGHRAYHPHEENGYYN